MLRMIAHRDWILFVPSFGIAGPVINHQSRHWQ